MEIKFIIKRINKTHPEYFYTFGEDNFSYEFNLANRYDLYSEAEEKIRSIKERGVYQIDKIFIKE